MDGRGDQAEPSTSPPHSSPHYLRREDHAGLAELDFQSPQVCSAHGRAVQHGDLGQGGQRVPLPVDVVSIPNYHHILQLVVADDLV